LSGIAANRGDQQHAAPVSGKAIDHFSNEHSGLRQFAIAFALSGAIDSARTAEA
jgi:hypothetical protein